MNEILAKMVRDYQIARHTFVTTRIGSAAGDRAERKMNRLVAKAETLGILDELVEAVNA